MQVAQQAQRDGDLVYPAGLLPPAAGYNAYERYMFTKVPCSEVTQKKAQANPVLHLISADQMFEWGSIYD